MFKSESYFSIVTPTFNRATLLSRVYESLKVQKFKSFEWIIVDDGSNDNTFNLVDSWIGCADFNIVYSFQNNSGKHIAYNRGVRLSSGLFVIVLDSDDELTSSALFDLQNLIEKLGRVNVTMLFTRSVSSEFCDYSNILLETYNDYYVNLYHSGLLDKECLPCIRKDQALKNLFPELNNVFLLEGFIWLDIGTQNKMHISNLVTRIYHQNSSFSLSSRVKTVFDHKMEFYFQWKLFMSYTLIKKCFSFKFSIYVVFYFYKFIKNYLRDILKFWK